MVLIWGEPGVGKSRITYEACAQLKSSGKVKALFCPADQIYSSPFNPFIYCLLDYFGLSSENSRFKNDLAFEKEYGELLIRLHQFQTAESEKAIADLSRSKNNLKTLLNLSGNDSPDQATDEKSRYYGIILAISAVIKAIALLSDVILVLEDYHWVDSDSKFLLQDLIRKNRNGGLMIILTSRNRENFLSGSSFLEADDVLEVNM